MDTIKPGTRSITVAVVDDDAKVRSDLAWLLNSAEGLRCPGLFPTCRAALEAFSEMAPEVLLLDVNLPGINGIEGIPLFHEKIPGLKIVMFSNYEDEDKIMRSRAAGAAGYLRKNTPAAALFEAIRTVQQGGEVWPAGSKTVSPPAVHSRGKNTAGTRSLAAAILLELRRWFRLV